MHINTVLISLATSIIVSLFTFILGLKSGKNQADRAMKQNIYKKIYLHFVNLEEAIKKDVPKKWSDYEINRSKNRYTPEVTKMEDNGDFIYINKSISSESIKLEEDIITWGSIISNNKERFHDLLVESIPKLEEGGTLKNNHYESAGDKIGKPFSEMNYSKLYNKEYIVEHFRDLEDNHGVIFRSSNNRFNYSFRIHKHNFITNSDDFFNELYSKSVDIPEFVNYASTKKDLINKINILKGKIEKRAKDPNTFWETLIGAFSDLFKI